MASNCTFTVEDTVKWAKPFVLGRIMQGWGGDPNQPALRSADNVRKTFFSAPLVWPFNRDEINFVTVAGQTDYTEIVPDWDRIEAVSITDINGNTTQIEVSGVLTESTHQDSPFRIAVQDDDNSQNITFRLMPAPDAVYTVRVIFQKLIVNLPGLGTSWAPIPDRYSYIYDRLFLAEMYKTFDYAKYQNEFSIAYRQLLELQTGMTQTQKNIFMEEKMRTLGIPAGK